MSSDSCIDYINNMPHGVVAILGSGKTFKSGTLYSLLDYCPNLMSRKKAFYEFPSVEKLFPASLKAYVVEDLDDVEPDSICIIEDANRVYPSRSSARTLDLQKWMGLISHKDILVMLTVQNTSNTDLAFFRDQDVIMVHKKMNPTAILYERDEFKVNCQRANILIDNYAAEYGLTYHYLSYLPDFDQVLILDNPPKWYGYDQSHALRDYKLHNKEELT